MQITEEEREKNRCLGGSQATSAQKLLVSCAQSVFMEETISSTILFRYAEPGSLRMCYLRRVCADSPNVWPFIPSENRIYEGDGSKPEYLCPITRVSNNQDSTSLSVVLFNPWSMTNKSFLMNNFVLSKMLLFFLISYWNLAVWLRVFVPTELCLDGYCFISQPQVCSCGGLTGVFWVQFSLNGRNTTVSRRLDIITCPKWLVFKWVQWLPILYHEAV